MVSELVSWQCHESKHCSKSWALLKINGSFWFNKKPFGRLVGHCNCGKKLGIPKPPELKH